MTEQEVSTLPLGLYKVYWKSGGNSLAAVGNSYAGKRWMAPTNWTSEIRELKNEDGARGYCDVATTSHWHEVEKVVHICDIPDESEQEVTVNIMELSWMKEHRQVIDVLLDKFDNIQQIKKAMNRINNDS